MCTFIWLLGETGVDGCCTVCVCQVLAVTIVCSVTSSHVRMVAGAQTLTTAQCAPVRRYVVDCFHIGQFKQIC